MKATALLETQHRKVESTLESLASGKEASALLMELANDLAAHMTIEQNIFYPAVCDLAPTLVHESFEEHSLAEVELKRLLDTPPGDGQFAARVATLAELVHHHVKKEEDQLFPRVESAIGSEALEELGDRLEQAFADAQREGFEALVPRTFAQTSADEALKIIASEAKAGAVSP